MRRSVLVFVVSCVLLAVGVLAQSPTRPLDIHITRGYPGTTGLMVTVSLETYSVSNAQNFTNAQGSWLTETWTMTVEAYDQAQTNALFSVIGAQQSNLPSVRYGVEAGWVPGTITEYEGSVTVSSRAEVVAVLTALAANIGQFPGAQ